MLISSLHTEALPLDSIVLIKAILTKCKDRQPDEVVNTKYASI